MIVASSSGSIPTSGNGNGDGDGEERTSEAATWAQATAPPPTSPSPRTTIVGSASSVSSPASRTYRSPSTTATTGLLSSRAKRVSGAAHQAFSGTATAPSARVAQKVRTPSG